MCIYKVYNIYVLLNLIFCKFSQNKVVTDKTNGFGNITQLLYYNRYNMFIHVYDVRLTEGSALILRIVNNMYNGSC